MKIVKIYYFFQFLTFLLLTTFLTNCIGKKLPEPVELNVFVTNNGLNSNQSEFINELSWRLKKNNVKVIRGDSSSPSSYSLAITQLYFSTNTKQVSEEINHPDCDRQVITETVRSNSVSLKMTLYHNNVAVKNWSLSRFDSGRIADAWLTKDPCDRRVASPKSFSAMIRNLTKKTRREIANTIYSIEFR